MNATFSLAISRTEDTHLESGYGVGITREINTFFINGTRRVVSWLKNEFDRLKRVAVYVAGFACRGGDGWANSRSTTTQRGTGW